MVGHHLHQGQEVSRIALSIQLLMVSTECNALAATVQHDFCPTLQNRPVLDNVCCLFRICHDEHGSFGVFSSPHEDLWITTADILQNSICIFPSVFELLHHMHPLVLCTLHTECSLRNQQADWTHAVKGALPSLRPPFALEQPAYEHLHYLLNSPV